MVPSQRYQDSRHLLQNLKVSRNVMDFSNHALGQIYILFHYSQFYTLLFYYLDHAIYKTVSLSSLALLLPVLVNFDPR